VFHFRFYSLDCLRNVEAGFVQKSKSVIQRGDGLFIEPSSSKPDEIDPFEPQRFLTCQNIRRNIFTYAETSANHRVISNSHKLMDRSEAADDYIISDNDVPTQWNTIRQDDVVSKPTIVGHVRVRHEQTIPSNVCSSALRSCPIERHKLSNDRLLANLKVRGLSSVLEVLRRPADGGPVKDLTFTAEARPAADKSAGTNPSSVSNDHVIFDDRKRPDGDVGSQLRLWAHNGVFIDLNAHEKIRN
jgi:hypothetical protein